MCSLYVYICEFAISILIYYVFPALISCESVILCMYILYMFPAPISYESSIYTCISYMFIDLISYESAIFTCMPYFFPEPISSASAICTCVSYVFPEPISCESAICQNGGTCNDTLDADSCICPDGFEGRYCEYGELTYFCNSANVFMTVFK